MELKQNFCLAVDLDGTLLNNQGKVSERSLFFLNNEWKRTIIFVTGRNEKDSKRITKQFTPGNNNLYVVFNDGQDIAKIEANGEYSIIQSFPYIEIDFFNMFVKWIDDKKINWTVYYRKKVVSVINDRNLIGFKLIKLISRKSDTEFIRKKDIKLLPKKQIIKISINGFKDISIDKVLLEFVSYFQNTVYVVKNDGMIEIKNKKASKLEALKYLFGEVLYSENNTCVYIGNGGNDIECLKYFSNSFAVENGIKEAKMAAKRITTSNDDDGVINALKTVLEEENGN